MTDNPQPLATYRFQFNHDFTFEDAQELVPYLARLGITHVYSSPVLRARADSTHGYDVVDPVTVNPNLGDETSFRALVTTLQAHGMGLILDIVPNHMAASSTENLYWRDVLMYGVSSRYAHWFDVDWRMPDADSWGRVLIPILGAPLSTILENDELGLTWEDGRFSLSYYDHVFPIDPSTVPTICRFGLDALEELLPDDYPALSEIRDVLSNLAKVPGHAARMRRPDDLVLDDVDGWLSQLALQIEISPLLHDWAVSTARNFGTGEEGRARLRKLLSKQCYRLAYWRQAARAINYRRFFDINDLISLRQEDPQVFEETHAIIGRWVSEGLLDGLRVDHVDGLRDPRGYLRRLSELASHREAEGACRVFVEKILAPKERLPDDWPVDGTTGYEFLNDVESVFVSPDGYEEIIDNYQRLLGQPVRWHKIERRAKRRVLRDELSSFVGRLADLLLRIARFDDDNEAMTEELLVRAIVEVVVGLPVYRSYADLETGEITSADRRWIETALVRARQSERADVDAIAFLGSVLLLEGQGELPENEQQERLKFIQRFQQLTGPAAAKGVEDTAIYSYVPLVSLNEVGGEPQRELGDAAIERLHRVNQHRLAEFPLAMLCSTTHDTKRTADVRSRLNVLSEMPKLWNGYVTRWRRMNQSLGRSVGGRRAPDASTEYLFYQSLVGIWPAANPTSEDRQILNTKTLEELAERLDQYMLKAVREAKIRTNWVENNTDYESALSDFIRQSICGDDSKDNSRSAFLADVDQLVSRIARCGFWNALARLVIQYTSPGTPDLYQGDELWNFALVDPDNRRPVDFSTRQRLLDETLIQFESQSHHDSLLTEMLESPEDGRIKLHVLRTLLQTRRQYPDLFASGAYISLEPTGPSSSHLISFARVNGTSAAIVVVPRLMYSLLNSPSSVPVGHTLWNRTTIPLPPELHGRTWLSPLTGDSTRPVKSVTSGADAVPVADALSSLPINVLVSVKA